MVFLEGVGGICARTLIGSSVNLKVARGQCNLHNDVIKKYNINKPTGAGHEVIPCDRLGVKIQELSDLLVQKVFHEQQDTA